MSEDEYVDTLHDIVEELWDQGRPIAWFLVSWFLAVTRAAIWARRKGLIP